jgi:uncharacterized protein HemX
VHQVTGFLAIAWAFLKRIPWELWLVLALAAGIALHWHADQKREQALVAAQTALATERAEHAVLLRQLADAKTAADAAIKAKAEAEKAAAKRLAAARKEWERIYSEKPENRAWADSRVPDDVVRRLRQ